MLLYINEYVIIIIIIYPGEGGGGYSVYSDIVFVLGSVHQWYSMCAGMQHYTSIFNYIIIM